VLVAIGRDGGNLSNLLRSGDLTLVLAEEVNDGLDSSLGTSSKIHGVAAGSNVLDGLGENGSTENSGGSGTVTSGLVGLGSNLLQKTSTQVLKLVTENNGLGNGNTILGDLGGTKGLLNENVAALGAESDRDGPGKSVDTLEEGSTALDTKLKLLGGESGVVSNVLETRSHRGFNKSGLHDV